MNTTRNFILMARDALNMTQEDFAIAISKSSRTVRRWESGEAKCSFDDAIAIIRLCKDSGVDIDTIVFLFLKRIYIMI